MTRRTPAAESGAHLRAALQANARDLLAYLERRVVDPQDAADLLGETLLTAWRRIDVLPTEPERARMWLFVTARNTLANFRRASIRRSDLTAALREHLAGSGGDFTDAVDGNARLVRDAVERLPENLRELVALVHWDGFSIQEAAELLGLNPSTARTRYASARRLLREALSENAPQPRAPAVR